MPSTSHRRCQYQGDGCMGTAHAGHDQCAHCYFTYIKPQIAAERLEVKHRRALKRRGHPTSGILEGNAQQEGGTQYHLVGEKKGPTPPPRPSKAIRDAIYDIELDRLIENKTDAEAADAVTAELQKSILSEVPLPVLPKPRTNPEPTEVFIEPTPEPPTLTRHVHAGGQDSHLSEAQVKEVIDAYQDGMTVVSICDVCNIATTTLYAILREHDVPLRKHQSWPARRTPAELTIKLTGAAPMPQSTPAVSPPTVEPAPTNGVVSGLTEWIVTYTVTRTETTVVQAKDFDAAAKAALHIFDEENDLEVISVARKRS